MIEFMSEFRFWLLCYCVFIPCVVYSKECPLPEKCELRLLYGVDNIETYVKGNKKGTIICDVNNNDFEFTFKASNLSVIAQQQTCEKNS